jgi:DNA-binding NarL/FixJ family response regulator
MYTHPDDVVFLHRINLFILTKLKELPLNRVNEFEIRFFRRMKNLKGIYCFCQQRISVLVCNDAGKAWLLKSFTTHPTLPDDLLEYQIRLFRMYPLDLYHGKRNVSEEEPVELTRLQYEILLLHTDGLTIMEIAVKTGKEAETIKEKLQVIRDKTGITSIKKLGAFAKQMDEMI